MAFNIFKKKKPAKSPQERTIRRARQNAELLAGKKSEKKEIKFNEVWKILAKPHVTEKATDLAGKNQYVFKVWPASNKSEIKKAVEELYGVNVLNVRIINIPAKQRRLGRITGERGGYKKAVVKIKEGQKIEVLPR